MNLVQLLAFGFTLLYTLAADFYFSSIGNTEFLGYIDVIVFLLVLGGYYNTAVDLCVNLFGAIICTVLAFIFWKREVSL